MERSRTQHSIRNSVVGIIGKTIALIGGYVTRVILVRSLAGPYVGLNGLLFNIVGGFMLTSMGLDTATAYSMYGPVTRKDQPKQAALLRLFGRLYRLFAVFVLLLGVCFYPFLPSMVNGEVEQSSLILIYALFLLNTILSYQWAAKGLMFLVTQNNYINELFSVLFWTIQYAAQCLALILTKSLIPYLIVTAACTLGKNICVSLYANRKFPFLKDQTRAEIEPEERRGITRNIRAMLLHKSGHVIINNTDNVLITSLFGVAAVGSYANYVLISESVSQLFHRLIYGISGSVGHIGVMEKAERVEKVFYSTLFIANWIYGFGAICLFALLEPFIRLSFGDAYVLPMTTTLVLCLNFYMNGVRKATLVFRDSLGLFWNDRYKSLAEGIVNLTASIVLARFMGLTGILVGTTVSYLCVSLWVEPMILFRDYLHVPLKRYFTRLAGHIFTVLAAGGVTFALCVLVRGEPFAVFLLRGVICLAASNGVLWMLSRGREEYAVFRKIVFSMLKKHTI